MDQFFEYDALSYNAGQYKHQTDKVTLESALQITINDAPYTVVMQTPGHEQELATGLLYAEDVIADFSKVQWEFKYNDHDFIEEVSLYTTKENLNDGYKSSRSLLSVSSCGICGKRELSDLALSDKEKVISSFQLEAKTITFLFDKLRENQELFSNTGGCHGIAAFDQFANPLSVHEDIGRHNALDKVIGDLMMNNALSKAKILAISGRISYEMVSKAFRAKIPIIAAVSAPSSLAIDFAKEFGLTLLGFCRENRWSCYAGPERLKK